MHRPQFEARTQIRLVLDWSWAGRSDPYPVNDPCSTMHAATGHARIHLTAWFERDLGAVPFQALAT
jgi:hypothetical protein